MKDENINSLFSCFPSLLDCNSSDLFSKHELTLTADSYVREIKMRRIFLALTLLFFVFVLTITVHFLLLKQ